MEWVLFAVGLWTGAALFYALEGRKQRRFLERWNGWPFRPDGRPRAQGRPRSFPEFSVRSVAGRSRSARGNARRR
jgi:hypothetical protein